VQFVSDPQTHNPYGYVRNNPIVLTDPDGRVINALGILAAIGTAIYYAASAYTAYISIRSAVESVTAGSSRIAGPQQGGPRGNAAVAQNTLTVSGQPSGKRVGSTAKNYGGQSQGGQPGLTSIEQIEARGVQVAGGNEFVYAETLQRLHEMAKDANANASFIVGAGVGKVAGFGALTVDANGNVTLDVGFGIGAGTLRAIALTAQGEIQGGHLGPVRFEFMAGGAVGGGVLQRSGVSLTSPGAATGGGFIGGLGGFVFIGPTVAIPLGNVSDFGGL
jgi:hypothetical protein